MNPLLLLVADNASVAEAVSLYDHQSRGRSVTWLKGNVFRKFNGAYRILGPGVDRVLSVGVSAPDALWA